MNIKPKDLLTDIIAIANDASHKIIEIYDKGFNVEQKEDKTPLTEADLAAHHTIVDKLTLLTPDIPILSEESSKISFDVRKRWSRYWLVDPLDGTREFIKRNGEFTVNIALIDHGRSILGVIVVPVSGACYFACEGFGAFKQDPWGKTEDIHVKKFDPNHIIVAGSRSHGSKRMDEFLANIGNHEIICMGSSLKSCLVAEGKADIYARLGLTSEWDTAAAQCIVEQAGGCVTETSKQALQYNTKESLLNPDFLVIGDTTHDWTKYLPAD